MQEFASTIAVILILTLVTFCRMARRDPVVEVANVTRTVKRSARDLPLEQTCGAVFTIKSTGVHFACVARPGSPKQTSLSGRRFAGAVVKEDHPPEFSCYVYLT